MAQRNIDVVLRIRAENADKLDKVIENIKTLSGPNQSAFGLQKISSDLVKVTDVATNAASALAKFYKSFGEPNSQQIISFFDKLTGAQNSLKASSEGYIVSSERMLATMRRGGEEYARTKREVDALATSFKNLKEHTNSPVSNSGLSFPKLTDTKWSSDLAALRARAAATAPSAGFAGSSYAGGSLDTAALSSLTDKTKEHTAAATANAAAVKASSESMQSAVLNANLLGFGIQTVVNQIKALTLETVQYAARTETQVVVTDRLSKVNGLNSVAVRQQVQNIKDLNITTQAAHETVQRMIFAQLDLSKATDLARLAQNAAVIANVDSSTALEGIINGIVTRQPRVLRTYGILVNFQQEFTKAARTLGHELSSTEKIQIALDLVLSKGPLIDGTYEAAMDTAGKRVTSLVRIFNELKNAVGSDFLGGFGLAVDTLSTFGELAAKHHTTVSLLATAIFAVGTAWASWRIGKVVISELQLLYYRQPDSDRHCC